MTIVFLMATGIIAGMARDASSQEGSSVARNHPSAAFSQFRSAYDRQDMESIVKLIESGLDVNGGDHNGFTPLTYTVAEAKDDAFAIDVAKQLIAKGANVNQEDSFQRVPLVHAVEKDKKALAAFFLENGADITGETPYKRPLVFLPFERQKPDLAYLIVAKCRDVNIRDSLGNTPLSWAARFGYRDSVTYLISRGADINNRSIYGKTPLMEAAEKGHDEVVQLLIQSKADVNARTKKGWSALMWAAEKGYVLIIIALIHARADLFATNDRGERALVIARKNGHPEAARIIEKAEWKEKLKKISLYTIPVFVLVIFIIAILNKRRRMKEGERPS